MHVTICPLHEQETLYRCWQTLQPLCFYTTVYPVLTAKGEEQGTQMPKSP